MANKPYMTSDDLIKSVKRRAAIPTSQVTFTDDDFLAFANEEMDLGLIPDIMKMHEDYLMYSVDLPMGEGISRFVIPPRAIGNKLRDVNYINPTGDIFKMTRLLQEDLDSYRYNGNDRSGYFYYVQNNEIILHPEKTVPTQGFVRFTYYIRPNRLVLLNQVGVITSIDRTLGQIGLNGVPAAFSTQLEFDFVQINSPHKTLAMDMTLTGLNSSTKIATLDPAVIPANLMVGDHLCISEQAAIPQIPSDLHVVLASKTAASCLESLGDMEGLAAINQKQKMYDEKMEILIDNRVEGSPLKVNNRNGALRRGLNFSRGRRF